MNKCIKCGSYAFNLYKDGIDQGGMCDVHYWQGRANRAEALAEQPAQQQEPLEYWNAVEGWVKIDEVREHFDSVGCGTIYKTPGDGRVPLTTAHRKPLTDEQIEDIWADCPADWDDKINVLTLARAIEAAHGIKENT